MGKQRKGWKKGGVIFPSQSGEKIETQLRKRKQAKMNSKYSFEELEIEFNKNTVAYVFGEVNYETTWDSYDFDYEGPQGTTPHRVGWKLELVDTQITDVNVEWFYILTKVEDKWMEVGTVNIRENSIEVDKDLLPILNKKIKENRKLIESINEDAFQREEERLDDDQ